MGVVLWHLVTIHLDRRDWCEVVKKVVESSGGYKIELNETSISVKISSDTLKALRVRVNAFYETVYLIAKMLETLTPNN